MNWKVLGEGVKGKKVEETIELLEVSQEQIVHFQIQKLL